MSLTYTPKILAVCPSIYPEKLKNMINSFDNTRSKHTDLAFSSQGNVTEAINTMFKQYNGYDFYFIANDDIIFETPLWDIALAKKGKISYGNDLLQGGNLCTFPMIDGDIVRALGWLQLPTLERYSGDQVWMIIGRILNILEYHPEVIIKHNWEGWDEKQGQRDLNELNKWAHKKMVDDIDKVKEALCQK